MGRHGRSSVQGGIPATEGHIDLNALPPVDVRDDTFVRQHWRADWIA